MIVSGKGATLHELNMKKKKIIIRTLSLILYYNIASYLYFLTRLHYALFLSRANVYR